MTEIPNDVLGKSLDQMEPGRIKETGTVARTAERFRRADSRITPSIPVYRVYASPKIINLTNII
jgi:hypothetical protein